MPRLDYTRIFATLLLLPHAFLLVLVLFNLAGDIGLMDLYGTRRINIIMGCIMLAGQMLTITALWRPGKFTALGPMAKLRVAALVWNFVNGGWLAFLFLKSKSSGMEQSFEMLLAFVTASALMIFAIDDKKP